MRPNPGGPWTRHGHPIPGITVDGPGRPPVARCGGPAICKDCAVNAAQIRARHEHPVLDHIRALGVIHPGDTLLLTADGHIDNTQAAELKRQVTDLMPGVNVVVTSGLQVTVQPAAAYIPERIPDGSYAEHDRGAQP
jgi:hypothetical protein